jgi:hypothetical protein
VPEQLPPPPLTPWPGGNQPLPPPPAPGPTFGAPTPGFRFPSAPLSTSPTDTGGLRTATIVLFWCAAGGTVLLLAALISRKVTWNSFTNGDRTFSDLRDADDFVQAASSVTSLIMLAALIVLSIWSLRTARHARLTGATAVSPGLACGSWYIPFGNAIVPFVLLRRIAGHRQRPRSMVNLWQGVLIAVWLVWVALRIVTNIDEDTAEDVSGRLSAEVVIGSILVVGMAALAFVASRAMKDVDGVR